MHFIESCMFLFLNPHDCKKEGRVQIIFCGDQQYATHALDRAQNIPLTHAIPSVCMESWEQRQIWSPWSHAITILTVFRACYTKCLYTFIQQILLLSFGLLSFWPLEWPHFTTLQPQQRGIPHNSLRHRQERSEKECSDVPMFWHPHCSAPPPPSLVNQSWAFVLQELGRFTAIHASQKSLHSVTTLADQEALTEIKLSTLPS